MDVDDEIKGLLGLGGIALVLSFFVPGWIGAGFGCEAAIEQFFDWAFKAAWWIKFPVLGAYLLAVYFGMLVAFALIAGAAYALYQVSTRAGYALAAFSETFVEFAIGLFLYALSGLAGLLAVPLRLAGQFIRDLAEEAYGFATAWWREEQELRRIYRADYTDEFRSYRAFKRYWQSLDENGEAPGSNEAEKTDPYENAVSLFGLEEPFTKAVLKARYRELMKGVHPDLVGPNGMAAKLNSAHETIKRRKGWK